jgi:N-acetylmuramoyl-L-alanine amidase
VTNVSRYPGATWRGPVPNQGATLVDPRLIVLHVMQGTLDGTDAAFHNVVFEASAHFGVGRDGTVYQWVPLDAQAWAEYLYNDSAWSIEHEGFSSDVTLSDATLAKYDEDLIAMYQGRARGLSEPQLEASVALVKWLGALIDQERGLPKGTAAKRTNLQGGVGVIGHGELGAAGGNHPECPGSAIIDQFNIALRETHVKKVEEAVTHPSQTVAVPIEKAVREMAQGTIKTPTKSQAGVFVAEAGAIVVYINDFIKFAHPGGTELVMLNAAAAGVTWISHHINKKKAATQAKAS